jgi:hypothetical protein
MGAGYSMLHEGIGMYHVRERIEIPEKQVICKLPYTMEMQVTA